MCMCRTTTKQYAACKSDYQGESNQYGKDTLAIEKSTHKKHLLKVCLLLRHVPLLYVLALQSVRIYWHTALKHQTAGEIPIKTDTKIYRLILLPMGQRGPSLYYILRDNMKVYME